MQPHETSHVCPLALGLTFAGFCLTGGRGRRALAEDEPAKKALALWGPFFEELEIQKLQQEISKREQPRTVAFTNVTVLPMGEPGVLRDQTVVVRDGRIESVGPAASAKIPSGSLRVNGRGRYLMPGLTDMHVHTLKRSVHMLLELACGVTSVREMCGFPWLLAQREQVRQGRLLAPNMYVASHILNYFPMGMYATVVKTTKEARAAVREQKAAGYDFIKVHNVAPHPLYDAILDEARQQNIRVVGHIPHDILVSEAVAAGQRTFEHLKGYYLDNTLEISKEDWLAATPRIGVWNCPTLYVRRGGYTPEQIKALDEKEEMRYVSRRDRQAWLAAGEDGNARNQRKIWEMSQEIFRKLLARGARFVAGTDSGSYDNTVPGFALREELSIMESLGMPAFDVLNAATANAAEAMERTAEFGTVKAGKRADLLLLDHDPLEGVSRLGKPRGVMVRGIWLDRSTLDSLLRKIETTYQRLGDDASLDNPSDGQVSRLVADMEAMTAKGWIFKDHQVDDLAALLTSRGREADARRVTGSRASSAN